MNRAVTDDNAKAEARASTTTTARRGTLTTAGRLRPRKEVDLEDE